MSLCLLFSRLAQSHADGIRTSSVALRYLRPYETFTPGRSGARNGSMSWKIEKRILSTNFQHGQTHSHACLLTHDCVESSSRDRQKETNAISLAAGQCHKNALVLKVGNYIHRSWGSVFTWGIPSLRDGRFFNDLIPRDPNQESRGKIQLLRAFVARSCDQGFSKSSELFQECGIRDE